MSQTITPTIELIHGDCREILPTLKFDIIISDPPYGIDFVKGDSGNAVGGRKSLRRNAGPIVGDDIPFDPSHLKDYRCVLFGGNHFYDRLPPGGALHAWDKKAHSTLDDSFSDVEFIWTSWPCKSRMITHLWKGVQQASEKGKPKYHVNQKPIAVMMKLIEWFTEPNDVICDPYAGSGSTLVACMKAGRSGIGIEIDDGMVKTARRRLAEAETPLFDQAF